MLPNDRYAPVYTLTMGRSRGSGGVDLPEEPGSSGETPAGRSVTSPDGAA